MSEKNNAADSGENILIVEDSETQANQLADLLVRNGFRIRIANDGISGLAMARASRPTMIISDISMPGMDGFEMCRELKQDTSLQSVPVILLTALTSLHDVIKGLDCGADNFIRKPFDEKYLLGRIRFILANAELRSKERVQLGMQINLSGKTHFVTAERQQIFDLLISTYEEAIHMTEELREQQRQISRSYQSLEGLYHLTATLNPALTEKEVIENALESVLDLPGIMGGRIDLLDGDGNFHTIASHGFDGHAGAGKTYAEDIFRSRLLKGELREPEIIEESPSFEDASNALVVTERHLSVPLTVGTHSLGIMILVIDGYGNIKEEDTHVLHAVGNQIAIAIERANLYTNMENLVRIRTEALQVERNLLSAILEMTDALVILIDTNGDIVSFNAAAEKILGWKFEEVWNRKYWEIFLDNGNAQLIKSLLENMDTSKVLPHIERDWICRDGSRRNIIWSTTYIKHSDQSLEYLLVTGLDVTDLRIAQEKIQYLSNFDTVTGLPNRILLRDRVKILQEKVLITQNVLGLLIIYFPRLSLVRENLGTHLECVLLQEIAGRLKEWARTDDTAVRFNDNCFAVVTVRQVANEFSAVARDVLARLGQPYLIEQQEVHMDAYVGISIFPNDGDDFDTLAQCAEFAMGRATGNVERIEFYKPELNRGANERFRLENALRRALERNEFLLHYQPQVDLRTGEIVGFEALLRWQHPEFGLIPPARFVGLAEETGLILPIGEWVLRKACAQGRAWRDAGLPALPIAVNLSAKQFSGKIPETVKMVLEETGFEAHLLELELTESLTMEDPESTIAILRILKGMGVQLSIDDFGTGYSNLNYLKRFPVDKLKLDRSFVCDLTSDPDDLAISRAVFAMAHSLRLKVIAEGVETEGQLSLLIQNNCDEMQGYFFSKPVDADVCARLLREEKRLELEKMIRQPYEKTLLFIDDEVNVGTAIRRLLRNKGYKLFLTSSTQEAFEILATTEVGVVLCDQRMPGMNGTEFLSRIRQMYPSIVRMVLSGYTDLQSVTEAVNRGAIFKFLTKPWNEDELLHALKEAFQEFEGGQA